MKTPTEKPAVSSLPCRHLRTKRMYIPALAENALDHEAHPDDQSFYWCNRTLAALGLDDNQVHPCVCQPGRSCYET
jgi:hypothetical protein